MPNVIQIRRTLVPNTTDPTALSNNPPASGSLQPGEFGIELAGANPRLWVGVPTGIDPTGRRLVTDVTRAYVDGQFAAVGTGTVRRIATGAGLTGGPITSEGEIALLTPLAINLGGTGVDDINNAPFLLKAGGVMTGRLTLAFDPEDPMEPATRRYVDAISITAGAGITQITAGTGLRTTGQTNTITSPGGTLELARPVSISNGGTGVSTLPELREMLGLSASGGTGVTEITAGTGLLGGIIRTTGTIELNTPLRIQWGGTGADNAEDARLFLGIDAAIAEAVREAAGGVSSLTAGPGLRGTGPGVTDNVITAVGTIAIDAPLAVPLGGTGVDNMAALRDAILSGVGGFSLSAGEGIRMIPSSPITTTGSIAIDAPLGISLGGTQATTAAAALENLGGVPEPTASGSFLRTDSGTWVLGPTFDDVITEPTEAGNFLRTHTGTWVRGVLWPTGENTPYGANALANVSTGRGNIAVGPSALAANTTGSWNVAVGSWTLILNTTGDNNVAVGVNALRSNVTGTGNVAIGPGALFAHVGSYAIAIGDSALNTNITAAGNTAVGNAALRANTGAFNTALGQSASTSNTTGGSNTALGVNALFNNTTGGSNVAIGNNAAAGVGTGATLTVTNASIFIGVDARPSANSQTNQIVIGHQALGRGSNTVVLGNDDTTGLFCSGSLQLGAPAGPAPTGIGNINISGQYMINGVPFTGGGGDGLDPSLFLPLRGGILTTMTDARNPDGTFAAGLGLTIRNDRITSPEPALHFINNSPVARGGLLVDNFGAHGIFVNSQFGRGIHVELSETGGGAAYSAVAHTVGGVTLLLRTTVDAPSGGQIPTLEVSRGVVVGDPFGGDLGVGRINCADGYFVNGTRLLDDGSY